MISARLEFFDPHLFQKPATLDFLRGHNFETFGQLRVPIVPSIRISAPLALSIHSNTIGILRFARRRAQLQFPAIPSANIFLA